MSGKIECSRESHTQDLLDAFPYRAVIIDENGVIKRVNERWKKFARQNGLSMEDCGPGVNYVDIADNSRGEDSEKAADTAAGLRAVLKGEVEEFSLEYPCHSPDERYWFEMRATAFGDGALVLHEDITDRKLFEEKLARTNNRLNKEFARAKNLHDAMLPEKLPVLTNIKLAAHYQPAHKLGGDFYNFLETDDQLLFYISDVSGHDTSSSMVNIFLKEVMNSLLRAPECLGQDISSLLEPAAIMKYVRRNFQEFGLPADYFIALIVGGLDKKENNIRLCNMGIHFTPKLISRGEISSLSELGKPITSLQNLNYNYKEIEVNLQPGDIFFASTDGLMEQEAEGSDKMFGEERVEEILAENYENTPENIISKINRNLNEFKGDRPLQDDLTYIVIKRQEQ